ncbi:mRNA 3'-end-processing protein rna14 [Mucor velutinosus]|uniref:mRNA 3'-end-processing protein rna14 n=1 Tax=Mucor velutinosus TaxID=708070 RepID=A0AAN7D6Q3_9FUNG|nr:mRNA 3'-end-processing protein rna14 [Mucor velutinosus]
MEQNQQGQQVVLLGERREQEEPSAACQICRRNGFRGHKGMLIHQSKNVLCREMRRLVEAREALVGAGQAEGRNAVVERTQHEQVVEEQMEQAPAQEQAAQPTTLVGKACASGKEFVGAIFKLIQWIFKIIYSLMILFLGFSNIYFLYLYLTEKAPIINKSTYLLSPNFEEEFRIM